MKNTREHSTEKVKSLVDSNGRPPLQGIGIEKLFDNVSPFFCIDTSESVNQTNQGGTAEIITRPLQQETVQWTGFLFLTNHQH